LLLVSSACSPKLLLHCNSDNSLTRGLSILEFFGAFSVHPAVIF
jgi:hypothetical protein